MLQHECQTRVTRVTRVRHECNASATRAGRECYMNHTRATQVKNFDFDNGTSENIILHPYVNYIAVERLREEEPSFGNASFPCQNTIENCTAKMNLITAKAISKSYTLDCSCRCFRTFPYTFS